MSNHITASYLNDHSTQRVFSFRTILRNENTEHDSLSLAEWINTREYISLEQDITDKVHQKIGFSLSGISAGLYPLLRAIIASSRPRSFSFQAVTQSRSFMVEFEVSQEAEVKDYLSKILRIADAELRFKQVLRKVIINQEKFEREQKLLFMELSR